MHQALIGTHAEKRQVEGRESLLALGDSSSSAWGVGEPGRLKAPPAILDWKTVHEKLPWNVVFLLGGGYALAKGSEVREPHPSPACLRETPRQGKRGPSSVPHRGDLLPNWAPPGE